MREVNEELLEGHLMVTRDLVAFLSADKKFLIGSRADGTPNTHELLKVLQRSINCNFNHTDSKLVV